MFNYLKFNIMKNCNEKVATENAQIFKIVVLKKTDDVINIYSELTITPNKKVDKIKEIWSFEKLIQGFDMANANISEGDSSVCINTRHPQDNVSASLAISWDELTDDEMEYIKNNLKCLTN